MKPKVVIIGGGIVGAAIAKWLSKYDLEIILLEKTIDIGLGGSTKANTALIHAGEHNTPGSLMAKLCVRGNSMWYELAPMLGVPLRRVGCLVVALKDEEVKILRELEAQGKENGVPGLQMIEDREVLMKLEPNLNPKAVAALYAPSVGITSPVEMAMALAENAAGNGAKILLQTEVVNIRLRGTRVEGVETNRGYIQADYVINAAGLYADEISAKVGIDHFKITPRKAEYLVFDKDLGGLVNHVLFPIPTPLSKGIKVVPTVDGNLLAGPTARDIEDKTDTATTAAGLKEALEGALKLVPGLSSHLDKIITNYSGLRAVPSTGDFVIEAYDEVEGFINVAGIDSPGLTAAPAIAELVVELLRERGLDLREKSEYREGHQPIKRFAREFSAEKARELISQNPAYGHLICRCEHVTEGEILEAIRRGATTLDGIKFRTRAGMGRCQGGYCTPRIIKILSRELGVPAEKLTKRGGDSRLLSCEVKGGRGSRWKLTCSL
ncbi:MAG: NAD(P)/FAD-dependent oxidoreductase [Candidatus Hadarchaeales archaeon]